MKLINTYNIFYLDDEDEVIAFLNRNNIKKKDIIKIMQPDTLCCEWRIIIRNKAVSNR